MLSRLKKSITVTIRVRNLVILAVCIAVLLLGAYLRVPDNLFFMLLESDQVQSAYVWCGRGSMPLTREEIGEVVALLNDVRIIGPGERRDSYGVQLYYPLTLQLTDGTQLRFECNVKDRLRINGYQYDDIADASKPIRRFCSEKFEEYAKLHPLELEVAP